MWSREVDSEKSTRRVSRLRARLGASTEAPNRTQNTPNRTRNTPSPTRNTPSPTRNTPSPTRSIMTPSPTPSPTRSVAHNSESDSECYDSESDSKSGPYPDSSIRKAPRPKTQSRLGLGVRRGFPTRSAGSLGLLPARWVLVRPGPRGTCWGGGGSGWMGAAGRE